MSLSVGAKPDLMVLLESVIACFVLHFIENEFKDQKVAIKKIMANVDTVVGVGEMGDYRTFAQLHYPNTSTCNLRQKTMISWRKLHVLVRSLACAYKLKNNYSKCTCE